MADETRTALVTGGASGMGYAVASRLIDKGWSVTIVDVNEAMGNRAVAALGRNATFVQADVTKFSDQIAAFDKALERRGQIDFVFANAGIVGNADFYAPSLTWPPSPPDLLVEEVCLRGVINTSYLAMQYMRRNEPNGGVIVMTASAASIYASPELPIYTAAKHGVLGLG